MLIHLRPALVLLTVFTLLTGLAYPLAMTGLLQVALPGPANGSIVTRDGTVVGSRLIGQTFTTERYFHSRPSAAGETGYDASASSGSNLGPLSQKLLDRVKEGVAALPAAGHTGPVPADAVTTSASGLDPHISPAFAVLQVARIAAARGVPVERVRQILESAIEHPALGLVGEPRVNVLLVNLALDAALGKA